jgi:hypothetical protein
LNGEIHSTYTVTVKATSSYYPDMIISQNITIEPCPPGYEELVDNECTYCSAGTYNINADGKCLPCPVGAECIGGAFLSFSFVMIVISRDRKLTDTWRMYFIAGSSVYAAQGYWQETHDPTSYKFLLCSVKGSCCPNGFCAIEHPCGPNRSGTMCSVCDPGYSQWGDSCIRK